jgi:hypothetical protein
MRSVEGSVIGSMRGGRSDQAAGCPCSISSDARRKNCRSAYCITPS